MDAHESISLLRIIYNFTLFLCCYNSANAKLTISLDQNNITISSKYRPEIDGLRAFAVLAVIVNHFNKEILPSGYLGVDMFFVISGYVITSSLDGRKRTNIFDFITSFYAR